MSVDLMLPRIDGITTQQQLLQIKNYLFQMREQLQFALSNLSAENFSAEGRKSLIQSSYGQSDKESSEQDNRYQELKALIIKTAHTVEVKYNQIVNTLAYDYVSNSEFGDYREAAKAEITETAKNITQYYVLKTELDTALSPFESYITDTNAYIRTGLLYETSAGVPIYGVEIGQRSTQIIDGEEVVVMDNLVSRFTSDRLSFFQGEAEVAYISNQRLYITDAEIAGTLTVGYKQAGTYTVIPLGNGHVMHTIGD